MRLQDNHVLVLLIRAFLLCSVAIGVLIPASPAAAGEGTEVLKALSVPSDGRRSFNLVYDVADGAPETVTFCYEAAAGRVVVVLSGKTVRMQIEHEGEVAEIASGAFENPGKGFRLVIRLRTRRRDVIAGGRLALSTEDARTALPRAGSIKFGYVRGDKEWIRKFYAQPVGEAYFYDEFQRQSEALSNWRTVSGKWSLARLARNPERAASPFRLKFRPEQGKGGYFTGKRIWEDYRVACSAKPARRESSFGVIACATGSKDYCVFRWVGDTQDSPGHLELVRVHSGSEAVLQSRDIRFVPGQWYRIALFVSEGVFRGVVDGTPVLEANEPSLLFGKAGLYASAGQVLFDDVSVIGTRLSGKELRQADSRALASAAARDPTGRASVKKGHARRPMNRPWAGGACGWDKSGTLHWSPVTYLGDLKVAFAAAQGSAWKGKRSGSLVLAASPRAEDPVAASEGVLLVVDRDRKFGTLSASLRLGGKPASKPVVLPGPDLSSAELAVVNGLVNASVNGRKLPPLPHKLEWREMYAGATASGWTEDEWTGAVTAGSTGLLDYTFAHAPTEWFEQGGRWEEHSRWTCDPSYSWFGGVNRNGAARLWNKRPIRGDVSVEANVGAIMMSNGFPSGYHFPISFYVRLCADRMERGTGYTLCYGYTDLPSTIMRLDKVVAESNKGVDEAMFRRFNRVRAERIHRRWIHLKAEKVGATLRLIVDGEKLLEFVDDQPLEGGHICIGTVNNGISIARIRISGDFGEEILCTAKEE